MPGINTSNYVPYTIEGIARIRKRVLRFHRKHKNSGLIIQKSVARGFRKEVINTLLIPRHIFEKYQLCKQLGLLKLV